MRAAALIAGVLWAAAPAAAEPAPDAADEPPTDHDRVHGDPNWKMLDHVEQVMQRLAKHEKRGCAVAVDAAIAYVREHKAELRRLRRQARAQESSLCPKARTKSPRRLRARAEKMGERYGPLMFALYKNCDPHIDRLQREALQFIGSKCDSSAGKAQPAAETTPQQEPTGDQN